MPCETALYQYIFLSTQAEGEAGEPRRPDPGWLESTLAGAARHPYAWLGAPLPEAEPVIRVPEPSARRAVQRLYPPPGQPAGWQRDGPWAAYADVQLNNGTLTVQLAYACCGEADDGACRRLANAAWPVPHDPGFFLGQTLCFGGRVPDRAAAEAAAAAFLPADPAHPWPLRVVELPLGAGPDGEPWAGWLFDRPGLPDRLAFFYPDHDEAERRASAFFNTVLPDLALSLHKIAHQYGRGYEGGLRLILAEGERSLAGVLARALPPPAHADGLDAALKEVAAAYDAFAAELATFDRLAQAVQVNLANLQAAFSEHGLPRTGPLAVRLAAAERAAEQLAADRGFYAARVAQAQMALAALGVQADIERACLEREENRQAERQNLLLGFIAAVLALGQIMSDAVVLAFLRWLLGLFGRAPLDPMPAAILFIVKLGLIIAIGGAAVGLAWGVGRLWPRVRPRREKDRR